jgi:hypothetical protein
MGASAPYSLIGQEQGDHLALFRHEHIEGSARRTGVHDFETNSRPQKLGAEYRCRKSLPFAGSQQYEFGFEG